MKSSRVKPPATGAAPPPPTAHKMLRTPRRPSSLLVRYSSPRGKARSSMTNRGVISSNVSSICACKSGARLLAPSSYIHKISIHQVAYYVQGSNLGVTKGFPPSPHPPPLPPKKKGKENLILCILYARLFFFDKFNLLISKCINSCGITTYGSI